MSRFCIGFLAAIGIVASPLYSFDLDDTIASETLQSWQQVSPDISASFVNDADAEALVFVIDRGGSRDPFFLSLSHPHDPAGIAAFLGECEKALEQSGMEEGQKRAGLVLIGQSSQAQVREWLDKMATHSQKPSELGQMAVSGHPSVQIVMDKSLQLPHAVLAYNFHLPAARTYRDLRKLWAIELIQHMAMQRLAREGMLAPHGFDAREFLLPEASLRIVLSAEEQNWQKHLQFGLQQVKEIAEIGFAQAELEAAKRECLLAIQELQKEKGALSSSSRAAFQARSFLRSLSSLNYSPFLDSASLLVDSITPVDIALVMHECFSKELRTVSYLTPQVKDSAWIAEAQQIIDFVEKGETQQVAALPVVVLPPNLFEQLPLHEHEKAIIYEIIDTMANKNVIQLGLKRKKMEKKGDEVRHVHPLRFLGHIFADPYLRHCMREIKRSSFKWNGFIDGMRDRIEGEARRGGLLPYAQEFAIRVNRDESRIRHYLENRDWEGLVRFLL